MVDAACVVGTEASAERRLTVTRFGAEEAVLVPAGDVLIFPEGIVGMEELREFVLLDDARIAPCRWLQSLDEPAIAFVVVAPQLLVPAYTVEVSEADARQLRLADPAGAEVWTIVTVHPEPERSTVNLLAPVIVNRAGRRGKQVLLQESGYPVRYPIVPAGAGAVEQAASAGEVER
jgi:flagellar assembly factor FliW